MSSLAGVKRLSTGEIRRRNLLEAIGYADAQQATTRCALCGAYTRGLVADGKRWFEEHMEAEHGATVRRKR